MRIEQFCLDDREFFSEYTNTAAGNSIDVRSDPEAYRVVTDDYWTNLVPRGDEEFAAQGWKIHLSARFGRELEVVAAAAEICAEFGIAFKYVSSLAGYRLANSKNANRVTAGKLVTIYPPAGLLQRVLELLEARLAHIEGPDVLTDVRWKQGPVFVRFGAFRKLEKDGKFCVVRPDGVWEEDRRNPWFTLPDWAEVPGFLESAVARKAEHSVPFVVRSAFRQSNAGGVYTVEMITDGTEAVLKDGRRHAGYTLDGADGHTRIAHEARILHVLSAVAATPSVLWEADLSGHYMVVMSRLPGISLQRWIVQNMPLYTLDAEEWQSYAMRCAHIVAGIREAVAEIGAAGIVHGDIHTHNIVVDTDTSVVGIVDFETAVAVGEPVTRAINAPGYRPPDGLPPAKLDLYAVTKVITDLLTARVEHEDITEQRHNWTLPALFDRLRAANGSVPPALVELAAERARLLRDIGLPEVAEVTPPRGTFIETIATDMTAVIDAARRRLGHDPVYYEAFEDQLGGLGLGTAGYALIAEEDQRDSLVAELVRAGEAADRVGLFDGLCGSVYGLAALGAQSEALSLGRDVELLRSAPTARIFDGSAGMMLAALKLESYPAVSELISTDIERDVRSFATGYLGSAEQRLHERKIRSNRFVLQNSGLMYGDLGAAWLFATAHERFGDAVFVDAMNHALREELRRYELDPVAGLQYDDDGRLLPYLATGSAGFGVVLADIDRRVVDPEVVAAVPRLIDACAVAFSAGCGLFNGYAGLFYGANGLRKFSDRDLEPVGDLDDAVRAMAVHTSFGKWAVPGDLNFRVTTDIATGSAGIVHAARMAVKGHYGLLPTL